MCLQCAAGKFGTAEHQTSEAAACTPCPDGSFMGTTGATVCAECPAGTYDVDGAGSTSAEESCTACPAGTYNPSTGASSLGQCLQCPIGTSQPATGQSVCSECVEGKFRDTPGGTACQDCGTGTFQPSSNATVCLLCPAGKYNGQTGMARAVYCFDCLVGERSSPGDAQCSACPAGKYGTDDFTKRDPCISCPAGKASLAERAESDETCEACQLGQYSLGGFAECLPCPEGFFCQNTSSLEGCRPGTFSVEAYATSDNVCQNCPPGKVHCRPLLSGLLFEYTKHMVPKGRDMAGERLCRCDGMHFMPQWIQLHGQVCAHGVPAAIFLARGRGRLHAVCRWDVQQHVGGRRVYPVPEGLRVP